MPIRLTDRERQVVEYIQSYQVQHQRSPKLLEIAAHLGLRSKGALGNYLKNLEDKGYISRLGGSRSIELSEFCLAMLSPKNTLPLLGKIAAGSPIEAIPDETHVNLQQYFSGDEQFALLVSGDSMMDAGILDGDVVICRRAQDFSDKQIVVALIEHNETTLKYARKNNDGTITLIPANANYKEMTFAADEVLIQGVVVGQVRRYE